MRSPRQNSRVRRLATARRRFQELAAREALGQTTPYETMKLNRCAARSSLQDVVRLPRGTPLRMTKAATRQGLQGRLDRRTGTMMGPARERTCIRVLRDRAKSPETYHWSFWEPNDWNK